MNNGIGLRWRGSALAPYSKGATMPGDLTRKDLERMRNVYQRFEAFYADPQVMATDKRTVATDLLEMHTDNVLRLIALVEELARDAHWLFVLLLRDAPQVQTEEEIARALAIGERARALLPDEEPNA
jgi:hypothetical protein